MAKTRGMFVPDFSIFVSFGAGLWRTPTPEYSGVLSGEEKVLFFSPEKETGAESLKAPESVSGVLRVFQDII